MPSTFGAFMGKEFNETFESKFREFVSYKGTVQPQSLTSNLARDTDSTGTEDEVPFDKPTNDICLQSSPSTPLGEHERGRSLSRCHTQNNPRSHSRSQSRTHPRSQARLSSHASEHERGHSLPPHRVLDGTRDHSRSHSQSRVHTRTPPRSTPDHARSHSPSPRRSEDGTPIERGGTRSHSSSHPSRNTSEHGSGHYSSHLSTPSDSRSSQPHAHSAAYPGSRKKQRKKQHKNPFPLSVELPSKSSRPVSRRNAPQSPSPGSVPASDGANGRTKETQLGNGPDKLGGAVRAKVC